MVSLSVPLSFEHFLCRFKLFNINNVGNKFSHEKGISFAESGGSFVLNYLSSRESD